MEIAGSLVPQGLLVKGRLPLIANGQGCSRSQLAQARYGAGAKGAWRTAWVTLMKELAPQSRDGAYERPSYKFSFGQTAQLQVERTQTCSRPVLQARQPQL